MNGTKPLSMGMFSLRYTLAIKLGVTEKMMCDDYSRLSNLVKRYEDENDAVNGAQAKRALDDHKKKASCVQQSIRIEQQNSEACYANERVYKTVELDEILLEKISQPMKCPIKTNLNVNDLGSYSYTALKQECKLHGLKSRNEKPYYIKAIEAHYCSLTHGLSRYSAAKFVVKEEPI